MRGAFTMLVGVLFLSGCALGPPVTVRDTPPASLIQDCPEPMPNFKTNGDLVQYALDLRTVLQSCNADKEALRLWVQDPT